MTQPTIFLIDNFDSFTFNLVDCFEQLNCRVLVYRNTVSADRVLAANPDLVVISPGPSIPSRAGNLMPVLEKIITKFPVFGVCLGQEALIELFGGSLQYIEPVHGRASAIRHDEKTIFTTLPQDFKAGRYHSLVADVVPACFSVSATHDDLVMGIRHRTLPVEAVQFHPESVLTMRNNNGLTIISNLLNEYVL
ncbi:MAG: anthranilate synthase component II [Fidelibacterota bacterium]